MFRLIRSLSHRGDPFSENSKTLSVSLQFEMNTKVIIKLEF